MFCKNSHKYNWCSTKIYHKVAFNDLYNKPRILQHPVIDLNMELLVKIVNDFKQQTVFVLDVSQVLSLPLTKFFNVFLCFLRTTKELYHGFLERCLTQLGFYLNDRNTKNTRARCEMCLKIIVRIPERHQ